ncbi:hypothetical protein BDV12DRAFT_158969 [Aspergillus spectabilis]
MGQRRVWISWHQCPIGLLPLEGSASLPRALDFVFATITLLKTGAALSNLPRISIELSIGHEREVTPERLSPSFLVFL